MSWQDEYSEELETIEDARKLRRECDAANERRRGMTNTERVYPVPTKAARNRAAAHALIAVALTDKAAELVRNGRQGIATIIQSEADSHRDMLDNYKRRYGPNATI